MLIVAYKHIDGKAKIKPNVPSVAYVDTKPWCQPGTAKELDRLPDNLTEELDQTTLEIVLKKALVKTEDQLELERLQAAEAKKELSPEDRNKYIDMLIRNGKL